MVGAFSLHLTFGESPMNGASAALTLTLDPPINALVASVPSEIEQHIGEAVRAGLRRKPTLQAPLVGRERPTAPGRRSWCHVCFIHNRAAAGEGQGTTGGPRR
jgi:hypothetical protein